MRSALSRRLGLAAVFMAVTAIFGLGFLNAQGIRPPPRPGGGAIGGGIGKPGGIGGGFSGRPGNIGGGISKPGGAIGNPGIGDPGLGRIGGAKAGFGGGQTIYTCSGCGSRVSESSLSCPICKARFTNVGPDGKPIADGAGIGGRDFGPGFPQAQVIQGLQPAQVHGAESNSSLVIIMAVIAVAAILLGGGLAVFWVLRNDRNNDRHDRESQPSRRRQYSAEPS